jgi:DNA primase
LNSRQYGFLFSFPAWLRAKGLRLPAIRSDDLPGVDFHAVRSLILMSDVLALIGFAATVSSGDQLRGPCPIHGSSSPTSRIFSVHLSRNSYQCFKCGSKGNQLDLWAAYTNTDLYRTL